MEKFISVLIASILTSSTVLAQSSGDYKSIGSGNWNDATNWETYNGSTWVSTTTYPGQNSGSGAVTIKIFHELKLTATVPNPIASLLIEQLNDYTAEGIVISQNGIVTFSSGNPVSLRVSGDVLIRGELKIDDLNGTKTHSLFVGAAFEVGTIFYDECGISEMIPATFQTINQDDKLGVVFTGSTWINTGGVGITFQDVTFDGEGFFVSYPVHIKGNATFINGIVSIAHNEGYSNCTLGSSFTGDMFFYDGATVSGASNASFVDGWVYKIGDDPFTFPIGDQNVYAPLRISAPASQTAYVSAIYQRSNASEMGPISDPGLFNVSNCEVWSLNTGANNILDVTVSWSDASSCGSLPYITNVSEVTLARLSGYFQGWSSHGGSGIGTTTNGSVTLSGVNGYGTFTLGNLGACNTPWEGSVTNISSNSATLNWSAANAAISYDVEYKPYNSSVWINAATASTSTSVDLSGLISGMFYDLRIRTNCSSSFSPYKQRQFITLCGAPSGLSTTNITSSSAILSWLAVPNNVNFGTISYGVEYKQSTSTTWIPVAGGIGTLAYSLGGLTANSTYDWRVFTNCGIAASGNFAQSSFTTAQTPPPPPPPCNDVYETNNTSSQAKTINLGVVATAIISSANDVDWFKVTTPNFSFTNLQVDLTNLPADYDLYVYSKSLKLIASSINSETSNEVVIYNSNARKATYYIKVIPKNGAFNSSQCYTLLAQTVSGGNRTASHASVPKNEVTEDPNKQFLYPNPASAFVYLNFNSATEGLVNIQIVNSIGQLVKQHPVNTIKGHNQFKIQVADIRPGMYILRIDKGDLSMLRKFVIVR